MFLHKMPSVFSPLFKFVPKINVWLCSYQHRIGQTSAIKNYFILSHFNCFFIGPWVLYISTMKSVKRGTKSRKKLDKTRHKHIVGACTKTLVEGFYAQKKNSIGKNMFSETKRYPSTSVWLLSLDQCLVASPKTCFALFCLILPHFCYFSRFFNNLREEGSIKPKGL